MVNAFSGRVQGTGWESMSGPSPARAGTQKKSRTTPHNRLMASSLPCELALVDLVPTGDHGDLASPAVVLLPPRIRDLVEKGLLVGSDARGEGRDRALGPLPIDRR